jgi:bifunctional non-homologous end joining protein LigD
MPAAVGTSRQLAPYRRKRDRRRTPEPMGGRARGRGRLFVVQKHAARRLHYDLRLEMDGVLKSWAVPKGPSVDPAEKRLAVEVEDHPLEYADFEGVIPAGNYGAGEVIVWDRGTYRLHGTEPAPAQLAAGRLEVEFEGQKLRGRWMLVRTGRAAGEKRQWLLFRKRDASAGGTEPTAARPESVLSRRTLDEVARGLPPAGDLAARLAARRLPPARLGARDLPLMLPTLVAEVPTASGWVCEIKWDGVRVLAVRRGGRVALWSRNAREVSDRYPEVAAAIAALAGGDLALDGEIVALDADGRPSFHLLQRRMHETRGTAAAVPVTAYVYDCLALEGRDVRSLPLLERKALLAALVPRGGPVRYCDHVDEGGPAFLAAARELGLEGVVAKRADSPYRGGRRREWLKIKCQRRQEFVIGGWTDPKGSRASLGAVHVGVHDRGALVYVGRVGSGLDAAGLGDLERRLGALAIDRCPFTRGRPPAGREHHWVRPELVCEVRFTDWTPDGSIRHPVFLGLRADRRPKDVRRERPDLRPGS